MPLRAIDRVFRIDPQDFGRLYVGIVEPPARARSNNRWRPECINVAENVFCPTDLSAVNRALSATHPPDLDYETPIKRSSFNVSRAVKLNRQRFFAVSRYRHTVVAPMISLGVRSGGLRYV